jgi:ABC-2 type transport system ATP-binding protein
MIEVIGKFTPPISIRNLDIAGDHGFHLQIDALTLARGDVLGVVGANGSGKTTFIEGILGLRRRKSEAVNLFGRAWSNTVKHNDDLRRVGVQLQTAAYPANFKVSEIVSLHREMYLKADPVVLAELGIRELMRYSYGKLSRGQKQRVDLCVALAHIPELLFLDEPSTGLDQGFQSACNKMLSRRAENLDLTTVICSHDGEEISNCNRIIWLKNGAVHQLIGEQGQKGVLASIVSRKLRARVTDDKFDAVVRECSNSDVVLHHAREDSRTVVAFGHAGLEDFASVLKSNGMIDKWEIHDADGRDFLRVVSLESERKNA